jgi:hypothetical protein
MHEHEIDRHTKIYKYSVLDYIIVRLQGASLLPLPLYPHSLLSHLLARSLRVFILKDNTSTASLHNLQCRGSNAQPFSRLRLSNPIVYCRLVQYGT